MRLNAEYDKKIARSLREAMAEDGLPEAAEGPAPDAAWMDQPFKRARRKQFMSGLGRTAAIFLLVLMAGFGTLCAASSEVRAAVGNTIGRLYERWQGTYEIPETLEQRPANILRSVSCTDEENGWYYAIILTAMPGLEADPYHAGFIGIDLRHLYEENCWSEGYQTHFENGERVYMINRIQSRGVWFGLRSEAEKRDRELVQEILKKALDPAIYGDPDPAYYTFEVLDKELFFDLLKQALAGAPDEPSGKERDALLAGSAHPCVEPVWKDGYRFQIITAVRTCGIDEVYIDLQYKTGEAYNDYVQLSDLVEENKATAEQQALFELLQRARTVIKEQNSYTAMEAELKAAQFEGIDFGRLITFLQDMENGKTEGYHDDPGILPEEQEYISKEQWDEHLRKIGREDRIKP